MWAELLELKRIGLKQDVFALGADSITVTQIISRLQERFGVTFSFEDIFNAPTVSAMAARLETSRTDFSASVTLRSPADVRSAPLSFQQQRISVLSRLDTTRYNFNVVEVLRLLGPLDFRALKASIKAICARHEILRSTFSDRRDESVQLPGEADPRLEYLLIF